MSKDERKEMIENLPGGGVQGIGILHAGGLKINVVPGAVPAAFKFRILLPHRGGGDPGVVEGDLQSGVPADVHAVVAVDEIAAHGSTDDQQYHQDDQHRPSNYDAFYVRKLLCIEITRLDELRHFERDQYELYVLFLLITFLARPNKLRHFEGFRRGLFVLQLLELDHYLLQ